jgi:hypothetical protein
VHTHIRDLIEPVLALVIEIGIMQEGPTVDEIPAHVADGTLNLALGLRAIRSTGPRREAPVRGEAQKLEIVDERPAFDSQIARDHGLHLVEEQLPRHAAERASRRAKLSQDGVHILRHTFCSHLAMRGAPPRAIQELAGHREFGMTHALHAPESSSARQRNSTAGSAVSRTEFWRHFGDGEGLRRKDQWIEQLNWR